MTYREELGHRLADARLLAGYATPGALAEELARLGVRTERGKLASRRWVAGLEAGEYEPPLEHLPVIAATVKLKPWTLAWSAALQGDTDFVASMRALDDELDDRGRLTTLLTAQQQARMAPGLRPPAARERRRQAESGAAEFTAGGEDVDVPGEQDQEQAEDEAPTTR